MVAQYNMGHQASDKYGWFSFLFMPTRSIVIHTIFEKRKEKEGEEAMKWETIGLALSLNPKQKDPLLWIITLHGTIIIFPIIK